MVCLEPNGLLNTKLFSIRNHHENDGQQVPREVSLIVQRIRGPISAEGIWRLSDNKVKITLHQSSDIAQ